MVGCGSARRRQPEWCRHRRERRRAAGRDRDGHQPRQRFSGRLRDRHRRQVSGGIAAARRLRSGRRTGRVHPPDPAVEPDGRRRCDPRSPARRRRHRGNGDGQRQRLTGRGDALATVVGGDWRADRQPPGARAQLPLAGAADARRRPRSAPEPLQHHQVRRRRRSAQFVHHDHRRRRHRRRHPGQPDDQPVAGRRPGIQGLPQPVRRPVRECPERRGRGGLEVGHQPAARHRLLLRPRRRAERQERLRQDQARVPTGPRRRFGRRSAAPQQDLLLRHLRVQRRQRRADHRPAGQQSVRHRRERHLPLGPHQSPLQHQARPPVQRAALAVRPLRVRRPVHPAQQQHHLGLAPGRRLQHHAQRGGRGHVDPVAPAGQQPAGAFPDPERRHAHPQHGGGGDPALHRHRAGADLAAGTFPAPRPRSASRSTTTPPGTTSSWGATTPTRAAATSRTPTRPASSPSRPTCRSMRTPAPPGRSRW